MNVLYGLGTAIATKRVDQSGTPPSREIDKGALMAKKVLLVTDSSTTLLMEQMIVKSYTKHEFVTATDGFEAIQRAIQEKPDLVLMDVVMPRMNGVEACRRMRLEEGLTETPIVLVTTRGEEQCVEAGWQNGCTDYITKPINCRELVALIHSYLERNRVPARDTTGNLSLRDDAVSA